MEDHNQMLSDVGLPGTIGYIFQILEEILAFIENYQKDHPTADAAKEEGGYGRG